MKEIKAYIRPSRIREVADALVKKGIPDITIIPVEEIGERRDPENSRISIITHKLYSYTVKLEVVCADEETPQIVELIRHVGHMGTEGDGVIFVMDIAGVVEVCAES